MPHRIPKFDIEIRLIGTLRSNKLFQSRDARLQIGAIDHLGKCVIKIVRSLRFFVIQKVSLHFTVIGIRRRLRNFLPLCQQFPGRERTTLDQMVRHDRVYHILSPTLWHMAGDAVV